MQALGNTTTRHYSPAYHFNKSQRCYCGSPKAFGDCCANRDQMAVPHGIAVLNGFLSPSECKRFVRYADKQKRSWLEIVRTDSQGRRKNVRDKVRLTQRVNLEKKQEEVVGWMRKACQELLISKGQWVDWFETPQLLRYGIDGKYGLHSDAEHFDPSVNQFYRFIDRDFSMLIYLNDDYEGGRLKFPWIDYVYTPRAGDLVMFPSNHIFSHESELITRGNKFALVSWGAFRGSPRISAPKSRVLLRA